MTNLVASSPVLNDTQFSDNNGNPLSGGLIYSYESGGFTIPQPTYSDASGSILNANPIQLDSSGRLPSGLWLVDGWVYNFTLCDADSTVISSFENIQSVMAAPIGGNLATALWIPSPVIPDYVGSSTFNLAGFFTELFVVAGRVRYQFSDQTYAYGTITAVNYYDPITEVQIQPDTTGFSTDVINLSYSAATNPGSFIDAGAVTFTDSIAYNTNVVGGQLQTLNNQINQHAKSYAATLTDYNYTVNIGFPASTYEGMTLDLVFINSPVSVVPLTINVNNIGTIDLKQYDNTGALVDAVIKDGLCSRVMYNGTAMVLLDQLPYTAPPPAAPTFVANSGNTALGTDVPLTVGASGYLSFTASCMNYAGYGNFGQGTFTLYQNGSNVAVANSRTIEWDSRTSGCGVTLLSSTYATPGTTVTYKVLYVGPGATTQMLWSSITA